MKTLKLFVLAGVICCFGVGFAADEPKMPSEEEMMKRWMEVASPKAEHEMMAKMAGDWECSMKFWMGPEAPMQEGKGSCKDVVVAGGRHVSSMFTGEMMGMPYEGYGMSGYDNYNKVYWTTWTDNMTTGMMYMEGTSTDGGKTVVYTGTMDEPVMDVKDKPIRMVSKWIDDDHHVLESWDEIGTPHEFKAMEISYSRKK